MKPYDVFQGVYVHTPFCLRKCLYCDFPSYAGCPAALQERYVEALCREIRNPALSYWKKPVAPRATIYFGGGTPTVLSARQLGRVVAALKEAGWWRHPAEATIEANPGTVDPAKLQALRELGFDRLSLGVQSFHDRELQAIGRIHTAAQAVQAVAWAKEAGFARVSIDLMYGLPGQTPDSFRRSLDQALSLGLEHISAYSLIVEPGTPFAEQKLDLPDEDTEREMYARTAEILAEYGFFQYEISNYAKPGFACRHNIGYWKRTDYLGFGPSAASLFGNRRWTNTADRSLYLKACGALEKIREDEEILSRQDAMEEFMFLGLRMTQGISTAEFEEKFGKEIHAVYGGVLKKYEAMHLLQEHSGRLVLTRDGISVSNVILADFLL